MILDTIHVNA